MCQCQNHSILPHHLNVARTQQADNLSMMHGHTTSVYCSFIKNCRHVPVNLRSGSSTIISVKTPWLFLTPTYLRGISPHLAHTYLMHFALLMDFAVTTQHYAYFGSVPLSLSIVQSNGSLAGKIYSQTFLMFLRR